MDIVIDPSTILASILNEPERQRIREATRGLGLVAPTGIELEIGNALSELVKRKSLSIAQAISAYHAFVRIPIRLSAPDISASLIIAADEGIDAYRACYLSCAERHGLALLTLDVKLAEIASKRGIETASA